MDQRELGCVEIFHAARCRLALSLCRYSCTNIFTPLFRRNRPISFLHLRFLVYIQTISYDNTTQILSLVRSTLNIVSSAFATLPILSGCSRVFRRGNRHKKCRMYSVPSRLRHRLNILHPTSASTYAGDFEEAPHHPYAPNMAQASQYLPHYPNCPLHVQSPQQLKPHKISTMESTGYSIYPQNGCLTRTMPLGIKV